MNRTPETEEFFLTAEQVENVVNKIVPLIADPEEHDFVRAVLRLKGEMCTAARFAYFVSKLLKELEE